MDSTRQALNARCERFSQTQMINTSNEYICSLLRLAEPLLQVCPALLLNHLLHIVPISHASILPEFFRNIG